MTLFNKKIFLYFLVIIILLIAVVIFLCFYFNRRYSCSNEERLAGNFDSAVVFFADFDSNGNPDAESFRRFNFALRLYKENIVKNIVFVGGFRPALKLMGSKILADEAIKARVSREHVFYDRVSRDTISNWLEADKILKYKNFKNIVLISSMFHLFRIEKTIEVDKFFYKKVIYKCYPYTEYKYQMIISSFIDFFYNLISFIIYYIIPDGYYDLLIQQIRD